MDARRITSGTCALTMWNGSGVRMHRGVYVRCRRWCIEPYGIPCCGGRVDLDLQILPATKLRVPRNFSFPNNNNCGRHLSIFPVFPFITNAFCKAIVCMYGQWTGVNTYPPKTLGLCIQLSILHFDTLRPRVGSGGVECVINLFKYYVRKSATSTT